MTQWAGGVVLAPLASAGGLGAGKFLELVVGFLSSLLGRTHPPWSQRCDRALLPGGGSNHPPQPRPWLGLWQQLEGMESGECHAPMLSLLCPGSWHHIQNLDSFFTKISFLCAAWQKGHGRQGDGCRGLGTWWESGGILRKSPSGFRLTS